MPGPFQEVIALLAEALVESDLDQVRREVNPLNWRGKNPVKDVVRQTIKARRTGDPKEIRKAKAAHTPAIRYAEKHGLPRLQQQLKRHKDKVIKPIKPKKQLKPKRRAP